VAAATWQSYYTNATILLHTSPSLFALSLSLSLSLSLASLYLQVPRARLILLTSSLVINYSVPGHTTNTSAGTNGPATPVNGFSYVAKKRKEKVVIVEGRGWSSLH
jgi:hypothetical protein